MKGFNVQWHYVLAAVISLLAVAEIGTAAWYGQLLFAIPGAVAIIIILFWLPSAKLRMGLCVIAVTIMFGASFAGADHRPTETQYVPGPGKTVQVPQPGKTVYVTPPASNGGQDGKNDAPRTPKARKTSTPEASKSVTASTSPSASSSETASATASSSPSEPTDSGTPSPTETSATPTPGTSPSASASGGSTSSSAPPSSAETSATTPGASTTDTASPTG